MTTPGTTDAPLVITLFGPMQAWVEGQPLPRMRSRKGLWLLALLTLRHDRPVEREWLAGTLWPDVEQSQAFANLRPALSELRRALGSQGERLQSPARHTLLLELTGAEADIVTFDAAMAGNSFAAMKQAVALYRGPLLEGCFEEWVHQERTAREQKCLLMLARLAEEALKAGDYTTAVGCFQRASGIDPLWEGARRGWMEALAKQGDRNAALQVYRDFAALLRHDPNAIPDERTTALYERLRAEVRQQSRSPTVSLTEPAVAPKITGHLPHALTDLVGREDERLEVAARLRRSRLVTLTGLGGIGKTRLALEVAREVVSEYADGVWLVALDSLTEGKQVVPQIATVLGVKEEPGHSLLDSVTQHLRAKRLLLTLDNCEHLLDASARAAGHLLRECGELRILTTSREALEITGETAWMVPSLAAPDPAHLPSGKATLLRVLMGYESVQLFVERAQAVQKTFALTAGNARAVAQICFRLEGIPLALELAAARVKVLTVEQIAAKLDNELGLLTGGSRTAGARQQTLRAMLDWSYELLTEQERTLLRRLSVFAGGWDLEAAEGVCVGNEIEAEAVLDLLTALVDKSLVAFEEQHLEAGSRCRLLEMVRQYATERLQASGEGNQIKNRHGTWFLAMAEAAELHLRGGSQGQYLQRLDREYDNLRAALAWSGAQAHGAETELRLAGALWRFWYVRGDYSEGRWYLGRALEREEAQSRTMARALALNGAGALAYDQADYEAAQTLFQESLSLYRELEDRLGTAAALSNLGNVALSLGEQAPAQALYKESLTLRRESGDRHGIALTLSNLGIVARQQGNYALSRTLFEESLSISRELGDRLGMTRAFLNLGNVARHQGDHVLSRTCFEESLSISRELGDRQGVARSLGNLGNVALSLDEHTAAQALYEQGLRIFQELGDKQGIALSLGNLGAVAYEQTDYAAARTLFEESLNICRKLGDKRGSVESLEGLAAVLLEQKVVQKAVRLWRSALLLRDSLGSPLPVHEREQCDRLLEQARSAVGEDSFAAAWAEGNAMGWEQAIACALAGGE